MKNNIIFLLLLFSIVTVYSQQAITVSGGVATGSGGNVAYSIGQIVYTTNLGTTASIAQGVQQPFEFQTVLEIENNQITLDAITYPNPTNDFILLNSNYNDFSSISYQLYDTLGRLMQSKLISNSSEIIQMDNLPSAVYFLKIATNNKVVKTFKILKN